MDKYTYEGNDKGNYTVFYEGKPYAEIFRGEDDVIELVKHLNSCIIWWALTEKDSALQKFPTTGSGSTTLVKLSKRKLS